MQQINGTGICRKLSSKVATIILALAVWPTPAIASVDDLQIDWVVPAGTFADAKTIERGNVLFKVKPLPRKLYATTGEVTATGGQKLLPEGAQLYSMIGRHLLACSQAPGPEGYASHSSRICLLDSDDDGKFDSYFERHTGKAFLTSDGMWYAMNGNPGPALPLKGAAFVELPEPSPPSVRRCASSSISSTASVGAWVGATSRSVSIRMRGNSWAIAHPRK